MTTVEFSRLKCIQIARVVLDDGSPVRVWCILPGVPKITKKETGQYGLINGVIMKHAPNFAIEDEKLDSFDIPDAPRCTTIEQFQEYVINYYDVSEVRYNASIV